ncbi:hypothetical protein SO802_009756 [Lithocarpus litseifolius]|uniref:Reverse transcriptase zinc-binding domain-containing protein n=1 Tax=Lithocarpus litseifolius TaxID=425828 RepID=A0AAW2DDN3_9ROSI
MRWRIGDGKSINVYNDNWLPGKRSAKVLSPHAGALEGAQDAALINSDTRTWDQNVLQQHFLSFEVSHIKAIPLCWIDQEDCLIWPACMDGDYSVKMGYQLLCEAENSSAASSSDSSKQAFFWKCIWKLHIPNKIKFFLWRVCSNALPTMENLKRRKILEDAKCKACLVAQENTLHAIWNCFRVVVQNAKGEVLVALAEKISHPGSVEVLEALAVRRAAKFIVELGITGFVFEGDSEIVCRALRTADCGHSSIGQIVKDTMSIVGSLRTFSFSHIRR